MRVNLGFIIGPNGHIGEMIQRYSGGAIFARDESSHGTLTMYDDDAPDDRLVPLNSRCGWVFTKKGHKTEFEQRYGYWFYKNWNHTVEYGPFTRSQMEEIKRVG